MKLRTIMTKFTFSTHTDKLRQVEHEVKIAGLELKLKKARREYLKWILADPERTRVAASQWLIARLRDEMGESSAHD